MKNEAQLWSILSELDSEQKRAFRACIVWAALAVAASCGRTLTYKETGNLVCLFHRHLRPILDSVGAHCKLEGLPRLDCLVVLGGGKEKGKPGRKFDEGEDERVFAEKWLDMDNPGMAAFADAIRKCPKP